MNGGEGTGEVLSVKLTGSGDTCYRICPVSKGEVQFVTKLLHWIMLCDSILGRRECASTSPNMELTTDQDLDTTEFQLSALMSYIRATSRMWVRGCLSEQKRFKDTVLLKTKNKKPPQHDLQLAKLEN